MDTILQFDWTIFQWVERLWNPVMDAIMRAITLSGDGGIIWIALGLALCCVKKCRKYGVAVLFALLFSLLINDNIFKELFARERPYNLEAWKHSFIYPNLVEKLSSFSFPSGHTSSSFAAAGALWYSRKKWLIIPTTIWAILIGFSRIYVHVHYPTDVLGGILSGLLCAFLACLLLRCLEMFWKKRKERKTADK